MSIWPNIVQESFKRAIEGMYAQRSDKLALDLKEMREKVRSIEQVSIADNPRDTIHTMKMLARSALKELPRGKPRGWHRDHKSKKKV
jgi:hypothetical protein